MITECQRCGAPVSGDEFCAECREEIDEDNYAENARRMEADAEAEWEEEQRHRDAEAEEQERLDREEYGYRN